MADESERTIPATPRRREAARREGLMPSAAPLAWAAAAVTVVGLLPAWTRATLPAATDLVRHGLTPATPGDVLAAELPHHAAALALPAACLVAAAAMASLVTRLVCDGLSWQPARIAPRLHRIDPLAGLARILSFRALAGGLGSAAALAALATAGTLAAGPLVGVVAGDALDEGPARAALAAWRALVCLALAAVAVAGVQYAVTRLRFERRIRMTPQEFADELKGLQADPKVRRLLQQSGRG
jgi:flagellar biosynthetic protein FlhB